MLLLLLLLLLLLWRRLGQERRWVHALAAVGKLGRIRILLGVGADDGLIQRASHSDVIGQIGRQASIEIGRSGLQVAGQAAIGQGQVVILLLVHFFVDDVLLGDAEGAAGAALVDFRCSSGRLDSRLETSIAAAGGGNVRSVVSLARTIHRHHRISSPALEGRHQPLLVFFMCSFGLERLGRWDGPLGRHGGGDSVG